MTGMVGRLGNLALERRLRIRTRGVVPTSNADSVHYATMGYRSINRILNELRLGPGDEFVDIGCGKGRVVCCAARRQVGSVIGVELSADLAQAARVNVDRLRGRRAPVRIVTAAADDVDYRTASAVFLFDPFGATTMASVLDRIRATNERPELRIAYANPTQRHLLDQTPWLTKDRMITADGDRLEHPVAFYRRTE